jgi:hypothetical protein
LEFGGPAPQRIQVTHRILVGLAQEVGEAVYRRLGAATGCTVITRRANKNLSAASLMEDRELSLHPDSGFTAPVVDAVAATFNSDFNQAPPTWKLFSRTVREHGPGNRNERGLSSTLMDDVASDGQGSAGVTVVEFPARA